jgi:WD40 repeat protein
MELLCVDEGSFPGYYFSCIAFSPDGMQIALGRDDNQITLLDVATGQEVIALKGHLDSVSCVMFSPDGTRIASASSDGIKLWDATTGLELIPLNGSSKAATSVAFSPDGTQIVSVSYGDAVRLWDSQPIQETVVLKGHSVQVTCASFSPDGHQIVSGSMDGTIKLWNATSGREITTLKGHSGWVRSLAFSPDGSRIASAGDDQLIRLWSTNSGREVATFGGHSNAVSCIAFSADGTRIVSASSDGAKTEAQGLCEATLKVWDAATGQEVAAVNEYFGDVFRVAFSSDEKRLCFQSRWLQGGLWVEFDVDTGELDVHEGTWMDAQGSRIESPDGRWLIVPSENGQIILVDQHVRNMPRERKYREMKSRPSPRWHEKQANAAKESENWYAAAFHSGWLLDRSPASREYHDLFRRAWQNLDESQRQFLPSFARRAAELPKPPAGKRSD